MKDIEELCTYPKAVHQPIPMRMMIVSYELGDLQRALFRIVWLKERSKDFRGYVGEAKLGVADIITQLRILLHELGIDWDEMVELGEEHLLETWDALSSGEREA